MKKSNVRRNLVVGIALLAAAWFGWKYIANKNAEADKKAPKIIHVEATQAKPDTISQAVNVVGSLLSNESVQIKTEIDGRIASVSFKDGQEVKAKDPLFMLEDSVQQAELAKAKANLMLATNNVKRSSTLAKSGFTSKVGLEESQAELNLARANVQLAEANLEKTVIRAPFDGVVGIRKVSPGDIVSPSTTLVSIDQYSPIKIEFSMPERYLPNIKVQSTVMLKSDTLVDREVPATITAIDSRVGEASRGIRVQAIAENADRALYPGQFVNINLKLEGKENVLTLPDQALVTNANETFVYVIEGDKVKKTVVKTGLRAEDKVAILEGLKEGDLVVTAGQQKLQDGASVKVSEPTPVKKTDSPDETKATIN